MPHNRAQLVAARERAQTPPDVAAEASDPCRLNLGCGDDIRHGWLHMDAFYEHPDVIRHDYTRTPWPIASASVDYILASHTFEHILPMPCEHDHGAGVRRDIMYDVIEECDRVLKPGGVLEVLVPLALTRPAVGHAQHYRQWDETAFLSLNPNPREPYHRGTLVVERIRRQRSARLDQDRCDLPFRLNWRPRIRGSSAWEHLKIRAPRLARGIYWTFARRQELRVIMRKPHTDAVATLTPRLKEAQRTGK